MRRSLAVLLSGCLAALALLVVSPSAQAATAITGRLVDVTGSGAVAGMTVELVESIGGAPVATGVTDSAGNFSLDPGSTTTKFFVHAVAGDYQAGWVGAPGPRSLERDPAFARKFAAGATLGNVNANPAFIRGIVVNRKTKNPVPGVTVTVRPQGAPTIDGADVTGADGVFRIDGVTCEDNCMLKINGSAKGYETGFRACNAQVVPTWGAACASPLGRIGRVFLGRL